MEPAEDWLLTDRLRAEHGKGDPFAAAVRATRMAMIITDPTIDDNPIVFANTAFLTMTGYSREEIMGQNCRFLQGPDTDRETVERVREAIETRRDIAVDLLNYRRDGTPFWNALYLSPVINETGKLQYFFASQLDVTHRVDTHMATLLEKQHFEREVDRRTQELREALAAKTLLINEVDHRVKNNLQMISALIALQARAEPDRELKQSLTSLKGRIEAVGTVHRRLYQSQDVERFDVADFVNDLARDLVAAAGRDGIVVAVEAEPVEVPSARAAPLALLLNETITNALRHAFGDGPGRLEIEVRRHGDNMMISVADDGLGMPEGADRQEGFGTRLIGRLSGQLGATVSWREGNPGTCVEIEMPVETARPRATA